MTREFRSNFNTKPQYAIVDDSGKIIEKFRLKATASESMAHYRKIYLFGLKVVRLEDA